MIASIPSPSSGVIELGPLELHAYGLMIALGVVAAVALASRRLEARGGDPNLVSAIAVWALPAGLVGARLYHVITDWHRFDDGDWADAFKVWEGGLGIWGGIALGTLVGAFVARRRGERIAPLLDVVAPALPVAQAVGRWGNWWNQELFGRPTELPWALEIDPEKRPDGYGRYETFHPTFLYESLWLLLTAAVVLWVERRWPGRLRPGRLFALYVAVYTFGRFWFEGIRIDEASQLWGLRVNEWVSAAVFLVSAAFVVAGIRRDRRPADEDAPAGAVPPGR